MRRGLVCRLFAACAAAGALVLAAASPAGAGSATGTLVRMPDPGVTLARLVQDVGRRGPSLSAPPTAYLSKLDSHLQDVAASRLGGGSAAGAQAAAQREGVTMTPGGDASVDVYVGGDVAAAADQLRALGMRVIATSDHAPERMVEGYVPAAQLAGVAALASTHAVLSAVPSLSTGSVTSAGDATTDGPQARALGATGAGVTMGIISDSINDVSPGVAGSQSTGDLPPNVNFAHDETSGGSDEGRAMAEIAYDEAPGLSGIDFWTAEGGPAAKASAIDGLVADGVKVIADDTAYDTEPFFQDGVVEQAVDRAKAAGVAYFVSAGNNASQSWEGTYNGGATQNFGTSGAPDTIQTVATIPNMAVDNLILQWAEPWGAATSSFDVDVYTISGSTATFAFTDTTTPGIPEVRVPVTANGGSVTFGIAIRRVSGTGTPFMKYVDFSDGAGGQGAVSIEHATNSDAIDPDAGSAAGALTVAAADWHTPTTPEWFSSRGPVTHFFDPSGTPLATPEVRQKPNLAAPDNVNTTVAGFTGFQGTSAAAPAAAGIAALILSAKPSMSVDELYAIMTNTANTLPCQPSNGSTALNECGAGFLLADRALTMALDSTPPVIAATVTPAAPNGPNGWYHGPVSVSWSVSDPNSPLVDTTGCGPVSLSADASTALSCSATSAGGTATVPLTIKIDNSPPSAPSFGGIKAKTYAATAVPKAKAIRCTSTDATSGIQSCTVKGYGSGTGRHTLRATATDGAGLTATKTLSYTVSKPLAASKLTLAKGLTLAKLAASGLPATIHVAKAPTRLVIRLIIRMPKTPGHAPSAITLRGPPKRVSAGIVELRLKLDAKASQALARVSHVTVQLTVKATSAKAKSTTVRSSRVVGA